MSATTRNHQRPTEPRLEKKLPKDVFPPRAYSEPNSDLSGSLGDRHQHVVVIAYSTGIACYTDGVLFTFFLCRANARHR